MPNASPAWANSICKLIRASGPVVGVLVLVALACTRSANPDQARVVVGRVTQLDPTVEAAATEGTPLAQIYETPTLVPTVVVLGSPTPDPIRPEQANVGPPSHEVQPGDTLSINLKRY